LNENNETEWDVFISHASEDKEEVVEPLAAELQSKDLKVWYDRWVLKIGDRLLEKIDEGLLRSRYGIVVFSPSFLKKEWPRNELEGLMQKEVDGKKVILPIWHNVRRNDLMSYSPIIVGRLAGITKNGIKTLANELIIAMEDLPPRKNEISISQKVEVNISFKHLEITSEHHKYSFILGITLNAPPAKESFLLRLYWPTFIRITSEKNFTEKRPVLKNRKKYIEFSYQNDQRFYPGDTFEVISPQGRSELEYEFDSGIWFEVDDGKHKLMWEIFFEDQMPIKGEVNFTKLNIF